MAEQTAQEIVSVSDDDALLFAMIPGAVAEVDLERIAYLRTLTPAQRFQIACSLIEQAEAEAVERLLQRRPELSSAVALFIVRSEGVYD